MRIETQLCTLSTRHGAQANPVVSNYSALDFCSSRPREKPECDSGEILRRGATHLAVSSVGRLRGHTVHHQILESGPR